ncbi:MAG: hypothetical protein R3Y54_11450 [Eubacteriales bacterium]
MGLFSKSELIEARLPFKIQRIPDEGDEGYDDSEPGGLIDFEAYGRVGEMIESKYFYAMVGWHDIPYHECANTLLNENEIELNITVKFKNGKVKSFKIDFKGLARKLQDKRYEQLFMADDWISDTTSLVKDYL